MTTKVMHALRFEDTELDEDSLRKVGEELKETDESRKKCLEILKKKLLDKEDLKPCLDEDFLLAFLRVAKFDCNKAYQRILAYYTERWNLPEIFKDPSPGSVKIAESARQFLASPYRSTDHTAIIFVKRKEYDPSKVLYDLVLRAITMISIVLTRHPLNQMCGYTAILDMKQSSWSGWNDYTPGRLKMLARLFQKCMAMRIRAIHVMNAPPIYYLLYSIVYPFLTAKIKNRIFLHKNNVSLHSYIDPESLPKEYGGCLEQSELINLFNVLHENEEFLQKQSKYGFIKKKA